MSLCAYLLPIMLWVKGLSLSSLMQNLHCYNGNYTLRVRDKPDNKSLSKLQKDLISSILSSLPTEALDIIVLPLSEPTGK